MDGKETFATSNSPLPSAVTWTPPASYSTDSSPPSQGFSQESPGKISGVGGITFTPGPSLGRSGTIGSGRERRASSSRSSSWIAISVARYSPSPKWNQLSAPPVVQRKRLGQPSQP